MATANPFDLLGDDDTEDPTQLIAYQQQKVAAAAPATKKVPAQNQGKPASQAQAQAQQNKQAKLPSKPVPPSQAVREAKSETGRGGGRGYGRGRGSGGFNRGSADNENSFKSSGGPAGHNASEEGESGKPSERRPYGGSRGPYRGGRRGGFANGEVDDEERSRRVFERRSGTGRSGDIKREGSGRGNWGTQTDELSQVTEEVVNVTEKNLSDDKPVGDEGAEDGNKEAPADEAEEKEPEDKEMTLEEYEKVLEEKRKALQTLKTEERKVDTKEFESMQQLSNKKENDDVFIKLRSDKDRRKEAAERDEKAKKSVSINEFLKPAEGERYYSPGGRGRGRGRGSRGGFSGNYQGGFSGNYQGNAAAPSIADRGQFPTLGGK